MNNLTDSFSYLNLVRLAIIIQHQDVEKRLNMRILVTGATGFIGSNLVGRLKMLGHDVTGLVRSKGRQKRLSALGVKIKIGDVSDLKTVKEALKKVDVIYNLAAGLPHHKLSDQDYFSVNTRGVKNILEASTSHNLEQIVHVSTVGIYGETARRIVTEGSPRHLIDGYSKSKAAAEDLIFNYIKQNRVPVTIIRPTIAYGPGDLRPGFLDLFRLVSKNLFLPIGNGKNYFHTIYVENLVDGLVSVLLNKRSFGEDFIVGDEVCARMKDVYEQVAKIVNKKMWPISLPIGLGLLVGKFFEETQKYGIKGPLNTRRVKFMTENRRYSIEKAKKLLKYRPKVTLSEGLALTYDWYVSNGYLKK